MQHVLVTRCSQCYQQEIQGALKEENDALGANDINKKTTGKFTIVLTANTESLLKDPFNKADCMFFKIKLNLHNLTFHNLKSKRSQNFFWSEVEGDFEASNFVSIYIAFLDNPYCHCIILWSDGCTYQNRCKELANALLTFTVRHRIKNT